jgi:hypothetical protein
MNNISDLENLKDAKALRRERKKRPRMRQHGKSLKRTSLRPILHIHKSSRKNRR